MTARKPLLRLAAAAAVSVLAFAAAPAHALPNAKAASADAYSIWVNTQLLPTKTPVRYGPDSRASQEFPPGAANPATASRLSVGPLPADGSLVTHLGLQTSIAGVDGTVPQATASSEVHDVSLLKQSSGVPVISASVIRAQANANCTENPNGNGTTFVNLKVNGTPIDYTPAPNTVIDLQVAKVILNEQRPAFDGRGIVVNAIHVISTTTGDPLFRGDIIVSHAMATVNCTNGAGSTGDANPVKIVKNVDKNLAAPGDTLTYTATITNTATQPCLVTAVIDHLPAGFTFVSTAGDLGTVLDVNPPPTRPGGGQELFVGNGKTIPVGGSMTQTFVVTVGDSLAPGVYYNNVEVFCANLGNFIKGLDAPVEIRETQPSPEPSESESPAPSPSESPEPLPHTGGPSPIWALTGLAVIGLALALRAARPNAV